MYLFLLPDLANIRAAENFCCCLTPYLRYLGFLPDYFGIWKWKFKFKLNTISSSLSFQHKAHRGPFLFPRCLTFFLNSLIKVTEKLLNKHKNKQNAPFGKTLICDDTKALLYSLESLLEHFHMRGGIQDNIMHH
jgi:hypothetical protein